MTCSACAARVEKSVSSVEGVSDVSVNLLKNSMTLMLDENKVRAEDIIENVRKAGYDAALKNTKIKNNTEKASKSNSYASEYKSLKNRLIVSAIFALPLFYLSMGHMMGWPLPPIFIGVENAMIFALTQILLLLPIVIAEYRYFKVGIKNLFRGSPNMDSLIAVGSGAAIIYGIYATYKIAFALGHGNTDVAHNFMMDMYFESAGMILTLITLGKTLEARAKRKTSEAITKLMDLTPKTAIVLRDGRELTVPTDEVVIGDTVIVKAGASIPVDGVIIEGFASVDESALTGESVPVEKQLGNKVIGGTVSKTGYFKMRAEKIGKDTALSEIIRLVDEATASKAPIARLADKISAIFVPAVMSIAFTAAALWLIAGYGFEFALSIGISVLVISCPCALGLATPAAIMVGTGKGAEKGILIKSAEALELTRKIDTVVLDKTGTVTEGKPVVTNIVSLDNDTELLRIAASAEGLSEHPLALAILEEAKRRGVELYGVESFEQIAGGGIRATVNGKTCVAGNQRLMRECGIASSELFAKGEVFANEGKTPIYFAYDQNPFGVIAVADKVKKSSKDAVSELREMGIDVIMLTGDNEKTARAISGEVGIERVISNVYPADKEKQIRELMAQGKCVAMVGDGVNDAPALARADVGIAIGAGTDIAIESANIVLMRSDLCDVPSAIRLGRATVRNIKQNLFWAFIYNVIGIPIAAGTLYIPLSLKLSPMLAALAMSMSSVFVVSNALRLRLYNPNKKQRRKREKKMKRAITVEGMMCQHCAARVKNALLAVEGVSEVVIDLDAKKVEVTFAGEQNDAALKSAIEAAGYTVTAIN